MFFRGRLLPSHSKQNHPSNYPTIIIRHASSSIHHPSNAGPTISKAYNACPSTRSTWHIASTVTPDLSAPAVVRFAHIPNVRLFMWVSPAPPVARPKPQRLPHLAALTRTVPLHVAPLSQPFAHCSSNISVVALLNEPRCFSAEPASLASYMINQPLHHVFGRAPWASFWSHTNLPATSQAEILMHLLTRMHRRPLGADSGRRYCERSKASSLTGPPPWPALQPLLDQSNLEPH